SSRPARPTSPTKKCVVAPLAEELRDLDADIFVNRKMCLVSEPGTEVRWIWERTPQHRNDFHKSVCGENREKADYSNFPVSIKDGDVLDPSQSLRGRRDIGIRFGTIEALEADIPAERAQRVLDA